MLSSGALTAADRSDEDAKAVAFANHAMLLSPPEVQQQCGREPGEQAASLALQAVTIALKSQLHIHARKTGFIGARTPMHFLKEAMLTTIYQPTIRCPSSRLYGLVYFLMGQ